MLKLLKWAYDLGVRQERVRIASHLRLMSTENRSRLNILDEMMSIPIASKKEISERQHQDFERAIRHEVQEIIDAITEARGDWVPGASIMFPGDTHKGPM